MQMSSKESTSENGCHIASKPHTLKLNKIKKIESFQKLWAECKLVSILILWARWPARHVYRPAVWWGRQEGVREHSETVKKQKQNKQFSLPENKTFIYQLCVKCPWKIFSFLYKSGPIPILPPYVCLQDVCFSLEFTLFFVLFHKHCIEDSVVLQILFPLIFISNI